MGLSDSTDNRLPAQAADQTQAVMAMAADNLGVYASLMFPGFTLYRHNAELIKVLHRVEQGSLDRVIITMPPRHGKSVITSHLFPSWYLGRHPDRDFIGGSHTIDLAKVFSAKVRNNLDPTTELGKTHTAIFPNSRLLPGSATKTDFHLTRGGGYRGTGRGGNITGRGAHVITIDDPIKGRKEAASETIREQTKNWYKSEVYTRLQPEGGAIIIISTRYHDDDLVGYVLREHAHEGWFQLNFSDIAEEDEGWRKKGEALWPEKFPVERLNRIRLSITDAEYMPQYRQRPGAADGVYFKAEWLRKCYLSKALGPEDVEKMNKVILVDPGGSKKKSDFTAIWVIGLAPDGNYYILDIVRDRLTLHQRCEAVMELQLRWFPIDRVLYEEYGLQADIEHIEYVMARKNRHFYIQPIGGKEKKDYRIKALEPLFRAGRIKLPRGLSYCPLSEDLAKEVDLIRQFVDEEYKSYPSSLHDDMLDALARIIDKDAQLDWPDPERPADTPQRRRWPDKQAPKSTGGWMAA